MTLLRQNNFAGDITRDGDNDHFKSDDEQPEGHQRSRVNSDPERMSPQLLEKEEHKRQVNDKIRLLLETAS